MANCEELLRSIRPGMKLDKAFFLRIYGHEIGHPGFRETAIKALEAVGCGMAMEYYDSVVGEYEKGYQEQMKEIGRWYLEELDKEWEKKVKAGEEKQKWEEMKQNSRKWMESLL